MKKSLYDIVIQRSRIREVEITKYKSMHLKFMESKGGSSGYEEVF